MFIGPASFPSRTRTVRLLALLGALTLSPVTAGGVAPTIEFPPTSQTTILGGRAIFTVIASGDAPFSYQWRKDGVDLAGGPGVAGATSDALILTDLQFQDTGAYSVAVTNAFGSASSADVALTVNLPQPGDLDESFDLGSQLNGAVYSKAIVQPDGKILIRGSFTAVNGAARAGLARLNPDGTTDHTFLNGMSGASDVYDMALLPDARILIGGEFTTVNGVARHRIARLHADGSLDTTFLDTLADANGYVRTIAAQPDGRVIIGGTFTVIDGQSHRHIARLNADGSLDPSFLDGLRPDSSYVGEVALQADGRVLVSGGFGWVDGSPPYPRFMDRLHANGTLDQTYMNGLAGPDQRPLTIVVEPNGQALIAGFFEVVNGQLRRYVARLSANGPVDSLAAGFTAETAWLNDVARAAAGRVIIGGHFTTLDGVNRLCIARLNPDGSLDTTFGQGLPGANATVTSVTVTPDGRVLVGGHFTEINGVIREGLARLNADGTGDTTFSNGPGGVNDTLYSIVPQPDGRVLAGGDFTTIAGTSRSYVARFHPDGSLDTTFLDDLTGPNGRVRSITVQPDHRVIIGGRFSQVDGETRRRLARLNADGSLDTTFLDGLAGLSGGSGTEVHAVALLPDGRLLVGGEFTAVNGVSRNRVARLASNGMLDESFLNGLAGANGRVRAVVLEPGGRALIGGDFTTINGVSRAYLARLNADGSLDTTFLDGLAGPDGSVHSLALEPDGRVLVGGSFLAIDGIVRGRLARLNADGSLDTTFLDGLDGANNTIRSLVREPDGRVWIGGDFSTVNGGSRNRIARLDSDGSLDSTFADGVAGADGTVESIALQPNGRALIGGDFTSVNGELRAYAARIHGTPCDSDGDLDGVCTGADCDDTNPNCTTDCTDADGDGFCVTADCDETNPNCTTDCTDSDEDGVRGCDGDCDDANPNCTADCTDADGDGFCVTTDCDDAKPNCTTDCTDADGDGFCGTADCDETNPSCTTDCTDSDEDGVRGCDGDCDDTNPNCTTDCTDADGDGFCVTTDCDDAKPNCMTDCTDADGDGFCVTGDCDDTDPLCTSNCTDVDDDGFCVTTDCDDTKPNCTTDCTDADGDDFCVTTDCDDMNPNCTTDCTDSDEDGVRGCDGDCDDMNPNCTTDCTDADGDDFCVTTDCDDARPNCTTDCTDTDGDGFCVTGDCDDTNPNCTTDCTDTDGDGFCIGADCDDSDPNCSVDCTDADGDGFCSPLDCDDTSAQIFPGAIEACTDGVDSDCDGLDDLVEEECTALAVTGLTFPDRSGPSWSEAAAANAYALYRGTIPATGFEPYDHLCNASQIDGTAAVDPDAPPLGEGFYYLVGGMRIQTGTPIDVSLGSGSGGAPRPDSSTISCGPRVYVDPDVLVDYGDGASWASAYSTVGRAVNHGAALDRGLEVWIRGSHDRPAFLFGALRPGFRLLGGFAGNETQVWERSPASSPTFLQGPAPALVRSVDANLVLDGVTLQNAVTGVEATVSGNRVELSDVTAETLSGFALDLTSSSHGRLFVEGSTFDGAGQGAIRVVAEAGTLGGRVRRNSFQGGSDAALRLEARAVGSDAEVALDVVANTISGGATGVVLGAHVNDVPRISTQSTFLGSSLIYGTSAEAVRVEATGDFVTETGAAAARAVPILVGNTLSDGGGAGVVSSASRSDGTGDPSIHEVRSNPRIWDNMITFHTGAGIEESTDDPAGGLVSDPEVVGNDLFGNGLHYLDEGAAGLTSVAEVNALAGAWDNLDVEPPFVDRNAGDYHLRRGTVLGAGAAMRYLANSTDPDLDSLWVQPAFDDSSWAVGTYGVGYDTGPPPNALGLLSTTVPAGTTSIFTRTSFTVENPAQVTALTIGADFDSGYAAWINGVEVFRSASLPAGPLDWNTVATEHESSNASVPVFEQHDISSVGLGALLQGQNVLAIGVWSAPQPTSDLVLVPQLIFNEEYAVIDAGHSDAPRSPIEDLDGEGRTFDGNHDGVVRSDIGADERRESP